MGKSAVVRAFGEIRAALAVLNAEVDGSVWSRFLRPIRWLVWRLVAWTFWPVPGRSRPHWRGGTGSRRPPVACRAPARAGPDPAPGRHLRRRDPHQRHRRRRHPCKRQRRFGRGCKWQLHRTCGCRRQLQRTCGRCPGPCAVAGPGAGAGDGSGVFAAGPDGRAGGTGRVWADSAVHGTPTCRKRGGIVLPGVGGSAGPGQRCRSHPRRAKGGTTGITNLGQPCPKHHKLRHTTGWKPTPASENEPPGWTSPTGRHYQSEHQDWEPPRWPGLTAPAG